AGSGVVGLLDLVLGREGAADRGLLFVGIHSGEDEMVVRDGDLSRPDYVAARDLFEGVDGERRRAVARGEQVGVHAQSGSWSHLGVLVDAVRPQDLLAGREPARGVGIGPRDDRLGLDAGAELAATHREDAAALADLVLLGRERDRIVGRSAGHVPEPARIRVASELVAFLTVGPPLPP